MLKVSDTNPYSADTYHVWRLVITDTFVNVVPLPGYTHPPTDPDHDGIYEDLNGNGRLDFADVVLYFNQMTWIAANEPITAFDLNGNGRIDFADIVALFNEI
jgi:PKD repeat protein